MSKKNDFLELDQPSDIALIGIVTNITAYKLAWILNKRLNIKLSSKTISEKKRKENSMALIKPINEKQVKENAPQYVIFEYISNSYENLHLVGNRKINYNEKRKSPYLIKEFKDFNYLLIIKSDKKEFLTTRYLKEIKLDHNIILSESLNLANIKNLNVLLF